jgi:tetratricopeptide (TPR) repeat protein
MKRGKLSKSNSVEDQNKKNSTFLLAKINGHYIIIGATITGFLGIVAAIMPAIINYDLKPVEQQKSQVISETKTEETQRDESKKSIVEDIQIILPEPEKPHPQAAYRHNATAKQLLDRIIILHDKEIKSLLDKVFLELEASHMIDDEFGETYYFYGVAYFKLGNYYIAISNNTQASNYYDESLHYFNKSEHLYLHRSNVYFDRGKTHAAIADIYQKKDFRKANEYYQKALDDFNMALINGYNYLENVYFAIGNIYYKTEEYQKSNECYTNALKTANDEYKPTREEIYFNRSNANFRIGMSYFFNGEYENAILYYEKSIDDNHANFSAHFELGKTYTFQKRWRDAVRQFDFILERNPRNFDIKTVKDSRKFALSMIE